MSQTPEELIFFMLIRQFRLLLAVSEEGIDSIDEMKRIAPWQKSKLNSQARSFGKESLLDIYNKLYKIDSETKSGKSALTLTQAIDFFLAGL